MSGAAGPPWLGAESENPRAAGPPWLRDEGEEDGDGAGGAILCRLESCRRVVPQDPPPAPEKLYCNADHKEKARAARRRGRAAARDASSEEPGSSPVAETGHPTVPRHYPSEHRAGDGSVDESDETAGGVGIGYASTVAGEPSWKDQPTPQFPGRHEWAEDVSPDGPAADDDAGAAAGEDEMWTTAGSDRAEPALRPRRVDPMWVMVAGGVLVLAVVLVIGVTIGRSSAPRYEVPPNARPASGEAGIPPTAPTTPVAIRPSVPIPSLAPPIPVGQTPGFVALSPSGRQAYVAQRAAGVVAVVDTYVNTVIATIPIAVGPPQYLTFSPDGRRVYVSVFDEARTIAAVAVLDTTTNEVLTTLPVRSRPFASAVTPDGAQLWVPNHDSGRISVISLEDPDDLEVIREIEVPPHPHWISMAPDGKTAYAASHESNALTVVDTASMAVTAAVPVGTSPHSVAAHPSRPLVAVCNYDGSSVSLVDSRTNTVVRTVRVGQNPQSVAWAPDGRHLYVTNVEASTVSVVDPDSDSVTATIPTGDSPTSVAVRPDGSEAYVSNLNSGSLTVINIAGVTGN